jgi:hypothetical protein
MNAAGLAGFTMGAVRRVRVERRFSAAYAADNQIAWATAVIFNDRSGPSLIVWSALGRQPEGWLYRVYTNSEPALVWLRSTRPVFRRSLGRLRSCLGMGILCNLLIDPVRLHYECSRNCVDCELIGVRRQRYVLKLG